MLHILYITAMTAALFAGRRDMDWVGVCIIAWVNALGGGVYLGIEYLGGSSPVAIIIACVIGLALRLLSIRATNGKCPSLFTTRSGIKTKTTALVRQPLLLLIESYYQPVFWVNLVLVAISRCGTGHR